MDPYKTTYRRDYVSKEIQPWKKFIAEQEFKDPIREAFKTYLQLRDTQPSPEPPSEYVDTYLAKFKEQYPKIAEKYYKTPIKSEAVEENFILDECTVYQVDYCDSSQDEAYRLERIRKNKIRLPDDWEIPLTTQKASYRPPTMLNSRALEKREQIKEENNINTDEHIRKILNIKTGFSEYQSVIGKLGEIIIEDELHGKIVHPQISELQAKDEDVTD